MEELNFKIKDNVREDYNTYDMRLVKYCNVFFVQMRSPAYIGRAWQYLVIYINMKFRQQSSMIIYQLILMCGDKLIKNYKKSYLEALNYIKNTWIIDYKKYLDCDNASGAISEVQNQGFGIKLTGNKLQKAEETGIKLSFTYKRRLKEICDKQIEKCNDPGYQGEGRFLNGGY